MLLQLPTGTELGKNPEFWAVILVPLPYFTIEESMANDYFLSPVTLWNYQGLTWLKNCFLTLQVKLKNEINSVSRQKIIFVSNLRPCCFIVFRAWFLNGKIWQQKQNYCSEFWIFLCIFNVFMYFENWKTAVSWKYKCIVILFDGQV